MAVVVQDRFGFAEDHADLGIGEDLVVGAHRRAQGHNHLFHQELQVLYVYFLRGQNLQNLVSDKGGCGI